MHTTDNQPTRLLLTIPEACRTLNVGRSTIYRLIDDGVLERVKLGKSSRITSASVYRAASVEVA